MERALVVEDEPEVARLCSALLVRAGFEPVSAANCGDALEFLTDAAHPVAFAYIDIVLPDGSGLDVAAAARRRMPELPILVATGRVGHVATLDGVVLHKPFTLAEFDAAVSDARHAVAPARD